MRSRRRSILWLGGLFFLLFQMSVGDVWAKTYNLRAASGTVQMPDGEVISFWGYADCGATPLASCTATPTLPGPVLEVPAGDTTLVVNLKNDLPGKPTSFMVAGQRIVPTPTGSSYTTEIAAGPGTTGTYTLSNLTPGTYLYESGTDQATQVQMGLYGALIVRPAGYSPTNKIDYGTSTLFNREAVLLLSDIDPDWHAAVASGLTYNAVYFNPKYWLINGKAYPDTKEVLANAGDLVLLRYLNAGSQDHVVVIQGLSQRGVADDGMTTYPLETPAVVMNPGQTQDLILAPSAEGIYPLFDRRLDITNRDHFPGGMITMVRVIDPTRTTTFTILSTPPLTATEGKTYGYSPVAVDPNNLSGPLTYALTAAPAGMTIDPATGRVTWLTPVAGNHTVTMEVRGLVGGVSTLMGQTSYRLDVNGRPVVDPIPDQTILAGNPFSYMVTARDPDPADTATYSFADFLPQAVNLTIDPVTGAISGVPEKPQEGSYTVTLQVQATDGKGGVGFQTFKLTVVSTVATPPAGGTAGGTAVTIAAVKYDPLNPTVARITDFKFIVNLDNAAVVNPDAVLPVPPCNPCPSHQFESNSPVVATGTVKNGVFMVEDPTVTAPTNNGNGSCDTGEVCVPGSLTLPDGRYLVTVLAGQVDPNSNVPLDLQMRNGGIYKMDGKHFTVPGPTTITVEMHPDPLPLSQVTVQVFHDNHRVDAMQDIAVEGPPARNGVVDHFSVTLKDALGNVSTDAFGNPICTQYDASGNPIPGTGGVCLTDDTGFVRIKNLPPDKYEVFAIPPAGSGWVQTTTLEGGKAIAALVEEGNNGFLPGGVGKLFYLVSHGFVRPCSFGDTADDCPANDIAGVGSISGTVYKIEPQRPPFLTQDGFGEPVRYPWVAVNDPNGNQVALVRGNATGFFTMSGVPDGLYTLVMWDDPHDYIISFATVALPDALGSRIIIARDTRFTAIGLGLADWYGTVRGTVFLDQNENGVQDAGEIGLPGEYVEVRHRDGSLLYATVTDALGQYKFREFFPFGHWMVAGIGYTRLGDPGMNIVAGDGLSWFGSQPVERRTDYGPVLTMGTLNYMGETNVINWGKKPYPLSGNPTPDPINNPSAVNDYKATNGGISGAVWYATTRNEEDIRFAAADAWEPGVPNLYLNLYERIVDPSTGETVKDSSTGAAVKGRLLGSVITDHFNRSMPADCPVLDANGTPATDPACQEVLRTWNQVRSAVWDGAYQFFHDQSDITQGTASGTLLNCDAVGVGSLPGQCHPLPPGTYLVELEVPANYLLVTENDRNVIDQGDTFVRALRDPMKCVGPRYKVTDPGQPDVGSDVNSCVLKEVTVEAGANAAADFHIFTEVPIPARIKGFVNDNFKIGNPAFRQGGVTGVPFIPVSIKDYSGREITRVYTDSEGHFEALVPSTYRVNVPNPTGISPNMVFVSANDPGPAANPDAHFSYYYGGIVFAFDLWPGKTVYPILPLEPLSGYLGNQGIDCGTAVLPQITGVSEPRGDNTGSFRLTIQGTGFGVSQGTGTATLDSTNLVVTSWSDTQIVAMIPATVSAGPRQLLVTAGNGKISPSGMTIHVIGSGYNPRFVMVDRLNPLLSTIQAAIDHADTFDPLRETVVLIPPGSYKENPILWKPVTLQGYGAGQTIVEGLFLDINDQRLWTNKMTGLIGTGAIKVVPGQEQAVANHYATITVVASATMTGRVLIDGMTIKGARIGSGVHINSFVHDSLISNNAIVFNFGNFAGGVSLGFPNYGDNQINNPRIHHNQILHNASVGEGGAIGAFNGVNGYQVDHNLICANGSEISGGGIAHFGTNLGTTPDRIANNDILFNWSYVDGAGIRIQGPPPVNPLDPSPGVGLVEIDSNRIQGNIANQDGGGLAVLQAGTYRVRVVNNMIVNNVSAGQGGAMAVQDASNLILINNTMAKNTSTSTSAALLQAAGPHSAGLVIYPNSTPFQKILPVGSPPMSDPYILNNIFWDNRAYEWNPTTRTLIYRIPIDLDTYLSTVPLTHLSNNFFTTVNPAGSNQVGKDPLFVSPYNTALTGVAIRAVGTLAEAPLIIPVAILQTPLAPAGNYHITGTSPAINSGIASLTFTGPVTISAPLVDIDGQTRPMDGIMDAGADEQMIPRPDLVVTAISSALSVAPGGNLSVTDTVKNQGTSQASGSMTQYYLSPDPLLGNDILLMGSREVQNLGVGASSTGTVTVTVPSTTAGRTYTLFACADNTKKVAEIIETNNCLASSTLVRVSGTTADTTAPTAPSTLTGTAISASRIDLSWTASTDSVGVTGYRIERCQGTGCTAFAQIATTTTATTYANTGLAASTSYVYRVRATDAAGNLSAYSVSAAATTLVDSTPPSVPLNLNATAFSSSQINLTWTVSTDNVGVTGYEVWGCQGALCATFSFVSTTTTTGYSHTGLTAGTNYSYIVRARDAAGNSSLDSSIGTATTPAPDSTPPTAPPTPPGLTATAASSTQINLSWGASTDNVGVTGYQVERCVGAGCAFPANPIPIATVTGTSYSNTGLTAGTSYSYRVRARDAAGNVSSYSNTATATTPAAATSGPDLTDNVALTTPTTVGPGGSLQVTDTVTNIGNVKAEGSITQYYMVLTGGTGTRILLGKREVQSLLPGGFSTGAVTVTVPTTRGTYTLTACADDLKKLAEIYESNNCSSGYSVTIQ